jgi:hypothetical protein
MALPASWGKDTELFLSKSVMNMEKACISSNHHKALYEKYCRRLLCLVVGLAAAGLLAVPSLSAQQAGSPATLTYIKVMKGSIPEYIALTVNTDGDGTYDGRQLNESPKPRSLKLSPDTTATLFRMAAALNPAGEPQESCQPGAENLHLSAQRTGKQGGVQLHAEQARAGSSELV